MAKSMTRWPHTARPKCSHIKMSILRVVVDGQTCDVCGKRPYLRVFFSCQQDGMALGHPTLTSSMLKDMEPKILEMQQLGMSESVIEQAVSGKYTDAQLDKLIQQRKGVIAAIHQQSGGSAITHSLAAPTSLQIDSEQNDKAETDDDGSKFVQRPEKAMKPRANHRACSNPKCTTKTCYACCPYFKDRAFQSIDSIVADDVSLIHDVIEEFIAKPVSEAKVVQWLGLPKPPISPMTRVQSFATAMEEMPSTETTNTISSSSPSGYSETFTSQSSVASPTGPKYTDTLRMQELEHQLCEMKGASSSVPSVPAPFWRQNQLPEHRSSVAYFEDAGLLKLEDKIPNQVNQVNGMGSSVSHPALSVGIETEHTTLPLRHCISRTNSERSSVSDEVEVEGGLTITEEAVEMQTPDIVTQV